MADKQKTTRKTTQRAKPTSSGKRPARRVQKEAVETAVAFKPAEANDAQPRKGSDGMSPFGSVVLFLVIAVCLWINVNETGYSPGGIMWARGILEHSVIMFAGYMLGTTRQR